MGLDFKIIYRGKKIGISADGFEYIGFEPPKGGREIQFGGVKWISTKEFWVNRLGVFVEHQNTWLNADEYPSTIGQIYTENNKDFTLYGVSANNPGKHVISETRIEATCSYPELKLLDSSNNYIELTSNDNSEPTFAVGLLAAYALIEDSLKYFDKTPSEPPKKSKRRLFGLF